MNPRNSKNFEKFWKLKKIIKKNINFGYSKIIVNIEEDKHNVNIKAYHF